MSEAASNRLHLPATSNGSRKGKKNKKEKNSARFNSLHAFDLKLQKRLNALEKGKIGALLETKRKNTSSVSGQYHEPPSTNSSYARGRMPVAAGGVQLVHLSYT